MLHFKWIACGASRWQWSTRKWWNCIREGKDYHTLEQLSPHFDAPYSQSQELSYSHCTGLQNRLFERKGQTGRLQFLGRKVKSAVMRDNDKMQQIYYYWVALWNIIGHHREVRLGHEVSQGIASLELLGIQSCSWTIWQGEFFSAQGLSFIDT